MSLKQNDFLVDTLLAEGKTKEEIEEILQEKPQRPWKKLEVVEITDEELAEYL